MDSKRTIIDIMGERYSNRTYQKKPIDREHRKAMYEVLGRVTKGQFGTPGRFHLITDTEEDEGSLRELGTYGIIRNAPAFIVGAVKKSDHYLEDYGYMLEKIVLHATSMGLGTCWLGGTFSKSGFARSISVGDDEAIPAVAATGYATARPGLVDSIARFSAGSNTRKPWGALFFSGDFTAPLNERDAGAYAVPIEMVRRAPSAANKQPWRIVKEPGQDMFHFYLQRTKMYRSGGKLIGKEDLQRVDMGIAMYHFESAAAESKLGGSWTVADPGIPADSGDCEYIVSWKGK